MKKLKFQVLDKETGLTHIITGLGFDNKGNLHSLDYEEIDYVRFIKDRFQVQQFNGETYDNVE